MSASRSDSICCLCSKLRSADLTRDHICFALLGGLQRVANRTRNCRPLFGFDPQLALASFRAPVELRTPPVLRFSPERGQPSGFLHSVQSWKERARLHLEGSVRDLLDAAGNPQAMKFVISNRP